VSDLIVRLATREDDASIRAVLRRNAMPGAMALAFAHEPSFFDAVEVEGYDHQVVVGEMGGQVVGAGLVAIRKVYLNGNPTEVGYLSSLRADPAIRGTTALARGYRFFRRLHDAQQRVPFYLSTIMEENLTARDILTSGRAGMPRYHEIGRYQTVVIPLIRRRSRQLPSGMRIVAGSVIGAEEVAAFLNEVGRMRQCYPVYTAADLQAPTGLLRGLSLDDVAVALAGNRVMGVLACWNQQPFRQHIVTSYTGMLHWARPAVNLTAALWGCRGLPCPGEPIRSLLAACVAIRNDDPLVFRALLRHQLATYAGRGQTFLFVGLASNDPLLPTASELWHLILHSRIYIVAWEDHRAAIDVVGDSLVPYLELGSL
jgi:hypothetical protein